MTIMLDTLFALRRTRLCALLLTVALVLTSLSSVPHVSARGSTTELGSASKKNDPVEGNYNITYIGAHSLIYESWSYANYSGWPALCSDSKHQSPVSFANMSHHSVQYPSYLRRLKLSPDCNFDSDTINMHVMNEQNKIFVTLHDENRTADAPLRLCTLTDPLNPKQRYRFQHISFHVPGEHLFPYGRADAEMHISFDTSPAPRERKEGAVSAVFGELAILNIAVALQVVNTVNTTDTLSTLALQQMLLDGALPPPHSRTTSPLFDGMNLSVLLPARQSYLLYNGSLTSPPCTEGVRWVVMSNPVPMTAEELHRLHVALKKAAMPNTFAPQRGNAREVQPLHKRAVYRFVDPLSTHSAELKSRKSLLRWVQKPLPLSADKYSASVEYVDNCYVDAELNESLRRDAEARERRAHSNTISRHASDSAPSSGDEGTKRQHVKGHDKETSEAVATRGAVTTMRDLFDGSEVTVCDDASSSKNSLDPYGADTGNTDERSKKYKRQKHTRRSDGSSDSDAAELHGTKKSSKRHRNTSDLEQRDAKAHKRRHKKKDDGSSDNGDRGWMARYTGWIRELSDDLWNKLRAHPYGALSTIFALLLLCYAMLALCTPRSTTLYDVGVDPQLLQPLRRTRRAADYGTNIP